MGGFTARRLKLRLFTESVELPIVSMQVTGGRMTAATAAIQVVPTDQVLELEARTLLHVFSYDSRAQGDSIEDFYILIGSGELSATRFVKRAQGTRSCVLMVRDFTTYWDDAKMYFRDGQAMEGESSTDTGVSAGTKTAAFAGAHITERGGSVGAAAAQLYQLLEGDAVAAPGVKGLMAGVLHMLESVGGISHGKKQFRGVNDFFTQAELRLRLSQMVGVASADDTSARLLKGGEFKKWLKYGLQQANRTISFRQVAELLMKRIYHQYTTVSSPYLSPERDVWSERRVPAGRKAANRLPDRYARIAKERIAVLDSHLKAIQSAREADMKVAETAAATGVVSSARARFGASYVPVLREQIPQTGSVETIGAGEGHDGGADQLRTEVSDVRHSEMESGRKVALDRFERAVFVDKERDTDAQALRDKLTTDDGKTPMSIATTDQAVGMERKTRETKALYEQALYGSATYKTVKEKRRLVSRLMLTVFSPDPWYMAPPKANVIFPDAYTTFQMQHDFRADVTRLQLETRAEHRSQEERDLGDRPKKQTHWAPDLEDVHGKLAKTSAEKGAQFIMDHEVFGGIIAIKLAVPDLDGFAESDGPCKVENLAYLQRLANYLFFKMRFAGRVGALHMPLNWDIVGGMPGVIFDQHRPDAVQEALGLEPTQYLAMFDTYEHTADQSGGSTVVQLSHIRTQREQANLLGGPYELTVSDGTETVIQKFITTAKMQVDDPLNQLRHGMSALKLPEGSERPTWGDPAPRWSGSAEFYLSPDSKEPVTIQMKGDYNADRPPSAYELDTTVPTPVTVTSVRPVDAGPRTLGALQDKIQDASLAVQRLSGTAPAVVHDRVEVTVKRTRRKTKKVPLEDVPFEEVVRPPWVAEIYRNDKIGGFYQEMFGCGAITDDEEGTTTNAMQAGMAAAASSANLSSPGTGLPCIPQSEKVAAAAADAGDRVLGLLQGKRSIAQAVDRLTAAYRSVRGTGQEQVFIDQYTRRPIATLRDILGKDFDVATVQYQPDGGPLGAEDPLILGEEGFHSRACGPYDGLALLAPGAIRQVDGTIATKAIDARVDPRKRRYQKVVAYQVALRGRGGLLG